MRRYKITAFPYTRQSGTIYVPAGVGDDDIEDYISEHWDKVNFNEPELDYVGTDFEVEAED